jgi:iron complex outermembrane recepter protein
MKTPSPRVIGLFAALVTLASAQIPNPSTSNPAKSDEVITLSEFSVSGAGDNSYMPAESTSGSRLAIKIKDLPYAVNVVTSEFLKDFNVFDVTEEMAYTSSVSGLDQGGGFSVRGFGGNIVLRNGFSRLGNFDRTSADRIEFIKGPAAAIYGQTNPGGIVNFITKQPKTRPTQSVMFSAGSYNTTREEIELTGPVSMGGDPKLFYVLNGSYFERSYIAPHQLTRTQSAYLGLIYKFSRTTNLSFNFDYVRQHNNVVAIPETFIATNPPTNRWTGLATDIATKSFSSPTDWNKRIVFTYDLFFEHRFNSIFSMRAGASLYRSPRYSYGSVGSAQYDPTTRQLIARNRRAQVGLLQGDGQSGSIDFVASYPLGSTTNKTLLTVDYFKNIGKRPTYQSASTTFGPATLSVDNPVFTPYVPFSFDRVGTDYVVSRFRNDHARTVGTFLRHQIWAFNDRLIFMGGVRYDNVSNYAHDDFALYPAGNPRAGQHVDDARWSAHNFSTTTGFNYRVTPAITFYASRSESFVPGGPGGINLAASPLVIVPNQTGLGYETGFKIDALDHRLSFTTSIYDIVLKNVQTTEVDPANPQGPLLITYDGGQKAHGVEVDGIWRITNRLQWLLGYGYTHSRLTERGIDVDIMSRQTNKIPYHQLGSAIKFQVNAPLNVYVNVRYLGAAFVDTAGGITNPTTRLIDTNDGRRVLKSPAYAVWNVGAAYRLKTGAYSQTINVTAKNVFDKEYVQLTRNLGDRRGYYVSYTIAH